MNKNLLNSIIKGQMTIISALVVSMLGLVFGSAPVFAQAVPQEMMQKFRVLDPELTDKYKSMYKDIQTGDNFSPSDGTLKFEVTDVNIPGNFDIPVTLQRHIPSIDERTNGLLVWHWQLPMIRGDYMNSDWGLQSAAEKNGWNIGKNCTGSYSTTIVAPNGASSYGVSPPAYWQGKQLSIPGKTSEKFLNNGSRQVTKSNYEVTSCITNNSSGEEGFVVTGPDGTIYTFNEFLSVDVFRQKPSWSPLHNYSKMVLISNIQDRFGNRVNYSYNANHELTDITASDGRRIHIEYEVYLETGDPTTNYVAVNRNRPKTVTANGKTWVYNYSASDPRDLSSVTLPDGSRWSYLNMRVMQDNVSASMYVLGNYNENGNNTPGFCNINPAWADGGANVNEAVKIVTVNSPEGLTTTYTLKPTYFGRSNVSSSVTHVPANPAFFPLSRDTDLYVSLKCSVSLSLRKKEITAASMAGSSTGITSQVWTYDYSANEGSYVNTAGNPLTAIAPNIVLPDVVTSNGAENYRSVTIRGPENKHVLYVDRKSNSITEGSVVAEDTLSLQNQLLKRKEYAFSLAEYVGDNWHKGIESPDQVTPLNPYTTQYRINKTLDTVEEYRVGGTDSYAIEYTNYDTYGFLRNWREYNNFSSKQKYTAQEYLHYPADHVLGLPTKTSISADGNTYTTIAEMVYNNDTSTAGLWHLPKEYRKYGVWKYRYTSYHTSATEPEALGQLARIEANDKALSADGTKSGANIYQAISSYRRGKAQIITTNARYNSTGALSFSRTVNDDGWITSITDLNGTTVNYGYNPVGLLTYVDLPGSWLDTFIQWDSTNGENTRHAYTCTLNAAKTACADSPLNDELDKFDAFYRLRESQTHDSITGKTKYQTWSYNTAHQPVFTSYVSYYSGETKGTTVQYDAMGRPTQQIQSGTNWQYYAYLNSNRVQSTDPLGNITITQYLAYGTPSQAEVIVVAAPENITTTRDINIYGDVIATTQSGGGKTLTEYNAYDAQHNLCKNTRADSGITVFTADAMGRPVTKAKGVKQGATGTVTNCNSAAAAGDIITTVYDNLGDVYKVTYPDTSPSLIYTRDNNGNLSDLSAGPTANHYHYNDLGMLIGETTTLPGKSLSLAYGYNSARQLSSITYPNGDVISQNPNGLGEAQSITRVSDSQIYANNINYYANGAIDSFTYGNGLSHKTTLNDMQLPYSITDSGSGFTALSYTYGYDNNRRVTSLVDNRNNAYSMNSLVYDGRGRLKTVTGNNGIGNSQLEYDGLDNITHYVSKDRDLTYNYLAGSNRLDTVTGTGAAAKNYAFLYDIYGNVTDNGTRDFIYNLAGQLTQSGSSSFTYDGYNRRVKESGAQGTSYSLYSQAGTLFHRYTSKGGINYIYLGKRLVAAEGAVEHRAQQHYRPFGSSVEGEKDDVGYTGHKYDKDLGLIYAQARYYDPVIGRFLSPDPIGSKDQFNLYAYVGNDPVNKTDPTGMQTYDPQGMAELHSALRSPAVQAALKGSAKEVAQAIKTGDFSKLDAKLEKVAKGVYEAKYGAGASGGDRAGKRHTPAANWLGRQLNMIKNGGELKCPTCDKTMNEPKQSTKGGGVDKDAAVGDHVDAKANGGDGASLKDMSNHKTICWECNNIKSDNK